MSSVFKWIMVERRKDGIRSRVQERRKKEGGGGEGAQLVI